MINGVMPVFRWQPAFLALSVVIAFASQTARTKLWPVPDPAFAVQDGAATVQARGCPPRGITVDGTILRVIDGDTVVVRSHTDYQIRLLDCWAPESRTKDADEKQRGLAAKARMQEIAADKPCRVFMPAAGTVADMVTMGRILGRVWILQDGAPTDADLSSIMVSEGHATATKQVNR